VDGIKNAPRPEMRAKASLQGRTGEYPAVIYSYGLSPAIGGCAYAFSFAAKGYGRRRRAAMASHGISGRCYALPVILSRRTILAAIAAQTLPVSAMATDAPNLTYADGMLYWPGGVARAACGMAGVRADKREGDHATPAGTFPLVQAFFRPDRLVPPLTALPLDPLERNMGWVDAPDDPRYNTLVTLPYPASAEALWRADGVYDLIVVIGYNTAPVTPGKGSAIFLHVARPDFSGTEGCIAVAQEVLLRLLGLLGPGSTITIDA
jgi:L,D-peptidoglycan transpeptidase YkuD (ErfK/YbiS/YcfS/YnhG family)